MEDGCPDCFPTQRLLGIEENRVRKLAKDYGKEKQKDVAIYQEGLEWFFAEAHLVIGKYPRFEILQYDPPTAASQLHRPDGSQ